MAQVSVATHTHAPSISIGAMLHYPSLPRGCAVGQLMRQASVLVHEVEVGHTWYY